METRQSWTRCYVADFKRNVSVHVPKRLSYDEGRGWARGAMHSVIVTSHNVKPVQKGFGTQKPNEESIRTIPRANCFILRSSVLPTSCTRGRIVKTVI